MIIVSDLIDLYVKQRLKSPSYRKGIYEKAIHLELRKSKFGHIILRNLHEVMAVNPSYHQEVKKITGEEKYQSIFWESDFGYLWYQGNFNRENPYFDLCVKDALDNKYVSHLDIGCGWGELNSRMALLEDITSTVGVDISEEIIMQASAKNNNSKIEYIHIDFSEWNSDKKFDLISIIGSTDYVPPHSFPHLLEKAILACNKEFVIVNSLRGIDFEKSLQIESAIEVKRYDVGYVQPINYLTSILQKKYSFSFETVKSGKDSSLTKIIKS